MFLGRPDDNVQPNVHKNTKYISINSVIVTTESFSPIIGDPCVIHWHLIYIPTSI